MKGVVPLKLHLMPNRRRLMDEDVMALRLTLHLLSNERFKSFSVPGLTVPEESESEDEVDEVVHTSNDDQPDKEVDKSSTHPVYPECMDDAIHTGGTIHSAEEEVNSFHCPCA
ncbi:unnamed protein product [Cochlearia groenlandica]